MITTKQAIEIVLNVASMWGENVEEGFRFRLEASMTDDKVREAVDFQGDGKPADQDIEDAMQVRDLWRAMDVLNALLKQQGCEHFDRACDGSLTDLCDIVMNG